MTTIGQLDRCNTTVVTEPSNIALTPRCPPELSVGMSTHGLNVGDAVQLARRLDRMPARLRVFGIAGREFGYGPFSRDLHGLLDPITDEVAARLGLSAETSLH